MSIACVLLITTARVHVARAGEPALDAAARQRVERVAQTKGLIAFWDFTRMEGGRWTAYHDDAVTDRAFPVSLRRMGDDKSYTPDDWPYRDDKSKLAFDSTGPFGHAAGFNKGYIFGEVARDALDGTPLDVHGRQPFTMIAWMKFTGKRHLVAGIWDEGGWDKYGGRRQIALFGGLFGSRGVIAHISATGAASYPQSNANGSQYARARAIDGGSFENEQWVAMATTFNPTTGELTAYLDGVATPRVIIDSVEKSALQDLTPKAGNPYPFAWRIFSPRAFMLKFNGYDGQSTGVYEHYLNIDTETGRVDYGRTCPDASKVKATFRVRFDVMRGGRSVLPKPAVFDVTETGGVSLPASAKMQPGDEIVTSLESRGGASGDASDGDWQRVGSAVHYHLREGAPFTFGRALGLGKGEIEHGSQLFIDGVAVFNRVLSDTELRSLSFAK
ncbi:MAG: hypothetical protein GC159_14820 [Phycisphaera sp.]|nr:hypothetical protein [Phycisphaera sp.]